MRTFPIFVSFDGKPPLVVGGGELAAVKTRLLLMRAPSIDVAADSVIVNTPKRMPTRIMIGINSAHEARPVARTRPFRPTRW